MRVLASLSAAVLLAGCGSVDTVPLVYVSTVKVGLNAAGGTAETPGADIMIGVEAKDAAFVPVAFTRTCRTEGEGLDGCQGYLVEPIKGQSVPEGDYGFSRLDMAKSNEDRLESEQEGMQAALTSAERNLASKKEQAEKFSTFTQRLEEWNSNRIEQGEVELPNDILEARQFVDSHTQESVSDAVTVAQGRVNTLSNEVQSASSRLEEARQLVNRLIGTSSQVSTRMEDALSVFGSFNGDMGAKADADGKKTKTSANASLSLGKTFATGVAAQHLAGGTGEAAKALGVAQCVNSALTIVEALPEAERPAAYKAFAKACSGELPN